MMKHSTKGIIVLIISLLLSTFAIQGVQANGIKVTTLHSNAKYKITLTSQEKGKGIKIVAFSAANGKTVNVTYAFVNKSAANASIEIDENMVLAPFRVITTNTDNLNYRPYTDIIKTDYDEYIRHLHDAGITVAFTSAKFNPEDAITRAESASMLAMALKLKLDAADNAKYKDINKHWGKKYINALLKKEIMVGYADKTFKPNSKISVAEVCTILSKNFEYKTKAQGVFTKLKKNQAYSSSVQNIFNLKILTPQDSIYKSFNETSNISRGNFAMMLSRALSTY